MVKVGGDLEKRREQQNKRTLGWKEGKAGNDATEDAEREGGDCEIFGSWLRPFVLSLSSPFVTKRERELLSHRREGKFGLVGGKKGRDFMGQTFGCTTMSLGLLVCLTLGEEE